MRRPGERGFTLIELVTSMAVGLTVTTMVTGSLIMYQKNSNRELDYTQAQQNARASLAVLEHHLRQAGYGTSTSASSGVIAIGSCGVGDGISCNAVDAGSDRLRLAAADASTMDSQALWAPGKSLLRSENKDNYGGGATCPPAIPNGSKIVISGPCPAAGGATVSSVLTIEKDVNDGQYCHKYQWSGALACSNYDDNQTLESGAYREVDFYISRTDAAHPTLMLDPDGSGSAAAVPVAYDIEDLQIQYGLDTSTPNPDRVVEMWCDQLALSSCATGLADDHTNQSRVIAVKVAVVARTPVADPGYASPSVTVADNTIPGGDGYVRWVYRSVIRLRSINP